MNETLALELALTIRHDGSGGVADDLGDEAGLRTWLAEYVDGDVTVDAALHRDVRELRQAVRALFAYAVRPGPASPVEPQAKRLMSRARALDLLNAAAARAQVTPRLEWPQNGTPVTRLSDVHGSATKADQIVAGLARAAIAFLAGPARESLRACTAPRCVRYFVKEHPRQQWCRSSCGNRARVARHYERHHGNETPSR